jgi:colicin import membrane protein
MRLLEHPTEPRRALSWALSVAVHLIFFALLVFNVTWQRKPPEPVTVDLWQDLPAASAQKAPTPPPPPRVEVKPPPPPPKVEPKPEPKPAPKEIEPPKPDIALKEKLEKEKLEKQKLEQKKIEEQKKLEDQKRLEEQKKAEKQKLEQTRLEEQKRFEEIRQRDMREITAAQARREQQSVATAQSKAADDSDAIARLRSRIRSFVVVPQELPGNPEAEFDVVLLPGGEVLSVKLVKSSGVAAYDNAVERAILKAQPLPVPSDPAAFARFRNLHLKFRPNE